MGGIRAGEKGDLGGRVGGLGELGVAWLKVQVPRDCEPRIETL